MKRIVWAGVALVAVLLAAAGYLAQFRPIVTPVPVEQVDAVSEKTGLADCFWNAVSTQGSLVVYPDSGATYWISQFALPAGSSLAFSAEFAHARHMSFNVYDPHGQPIDRLNDAMIEPQNGFSNPFRAGARRDGSQRHFAFQLAQADLHAGTPMSEQDRQRPGNTLFRPKGTQPVQLWLRIYVPDHGFDAKGGVPLPSPTLKLADGSSLSGAALCRQIVVKKGEILTAVVPKGATETLLHLASSTSPYHPAQPEPRWFAFYNPPYALAPYVFGTHFEGLMSALGTQRKGGAFSTLDSAYMLSLIDHRFGEVLVITGKAPKTPRTMAGAALMEAGDLRYWSLCQYHSINDPSLESCVFDEQVHQNSSGTYTIAISTAQKRPTNATPECGVTWMNWGTAGDGIGNPAGGMLIYRHMLPDANFKHSLFETHIPGDEAQVLGAYYPQAHYMSKAEFERTPCSGQP